jgi:transcriptional regulator with XRE-family HTH domain
MTRSVFSPEYKRLCQLLIKARERKGLTQAELGRLLRRHQAFVSGYERGQRRLDITELLDIAGALDIDPYFMQSVPSASHRWLSDSAPDRTAIGHFYTFGV